MMTFLIVLALSIALGILMLGLRYILFPRIAQWPLKSIKPLTLEILVLVATNFVFLFVVFIVFHKIEENEFSYLGANGQYEIAKAFLDGRKLPKDEYQGIRWLMLSASNGNEDAQGLLTLLGNTKVGSNTSSGSHQAEPKFAIEVIPANKIKTKLDEIAGLSEAKQDAKHFVDLINQQSRFVSMGAVPPKGLLLYGLPGTGKTLLARAIAGEAKRNIISVSGAAFEETYVGLGAARVRELFEIARKNKPSIIFIDEIDALAPSRGTHELTQSQIQTVNQLLSELQNLNEDKNSDIFVIGATNRIETIDQALLRPGRFDWQLHLRLPNSEDRAAILKKFLERVKLDSKVSLDMLVEKSAGYSSADLNNVVNEAAIIAVQNNKNSVDEASFEAAFKKIASYEKDLSPSFSIKIISPNEISTKLSAIAGMNEAKREVTEIVDFLKDPKAFTRLGAKPPGGVLIYGPPGTGKTMMARAIAGEAKATFITVSGSDFDERYVGVGASRVREMFKLARKYKPCIVFIDEIDALAKAREGGGGNNSGSDQTLNQFLTEMDNVQNHVNEGIIFIGATNRIDILDPAVLRPGRFDRKVYFRLPSLQEREDILQAQLKSIQYASDVDVKVLAKITSGYSGAELGNLVNEAAIEATRSGKKSVDMKSFEEANDKISMGTYQGNVGIPEEEKRRTAYHEAGHALVGLLHPDHPRALHKLTIGLRGESLGVTHFKLNSDEYSLTKNQFEALISTSLGGYVAEEIVYGKDNISSGASSDLVNANRLASKMVSELGMADNNSLIVEEVFPQDPAFLPSAEEIIKRDYQVAKDILEKNRDKLDLLAKTLLEKETLDYDEIVALLKIDRKSDKK